MPGLEDRFEPPAQFANASDQLHELVAELQQTDNFGPDDYLQGLNMVLLSMDYDPHYSERGRRILWGECISALGARAQAYTAMQANPGFDQTTITKPVVITGIPRTGTTALHKLLAIDPQFQGLQGWLISAPQPRPPADTWPTLPAFQNALERMQARMQAKPEMKKIHQMAAEEVDECVGVLRQGFISNVWCCAWSGASYDAWWQTQSEASCYQHYKRVLQLIGSREPNKRWLLKNPGHIDNLELLFAIFPDAQVIHTHRDPAKAIPSLCSLLFKNHAIIETGRETLRAHILGLREMEKWAKAVETAEPVRQQYQQQIHDVLHSDFHTDPLGTVRQIYRFLDLPLTTDVMTAMQQRISDKPELKHGTHHYSAEDFGLSASAIRERFSDYLQQHHL